MFHHWGPYTHAIVSIHRRNESEPDDMDAVPDQDHLYFDLQECFFLSAVVIPHHGHKKVYTVYIIYISIYIPCFSQLQVELV